MSEQNPKGLRATFARLEAAIASNLTEIKQLRDDQKKNQTDETDERITHLQAEVKSLKEELETAKNGKKDRPKKEVSAIAGFLFGDDDGDDDDDDD